MTNYEDYCFLKEGDIVELTNLAVSERYHGDTLEIQTQMESQVNIIARAGQTPRMLVTNFIPRQVISLIFKMFEYINVKFKDNENKRNSKNGKRSMF